MATVSRKYHGDVFKLKVALTAIKGNKSAAEMVQEFGVASNQICVWRKRLEEKGALVFSDWRRAENKGIELEKLHAIIGRLTVERDFLMQALNRSK
jgi:transposase-like protein